MNSFERRQAARKQRLETRAGALRTEGEARLSRARKMADIIPFGQPILIGHHSERGDRSYRAKIHANFGKGFDALKAAGEMAARAASVGAGGISSDDPDAIDKLRAELVVLEAQQVRAILANRLVRKEDRDGLAAAGFSAPEIAGLFTPDFAGRLGVPSFRLTNNGANMRRIKARIELLEKQATRETKETRLESGVRLIENAEANRLQLIFEGKPSAEVRAELKSHGFRWAPSEGAWQRQLSNGARHAADCVLRKLLN